MRLLILTIVLSASAYAQCPTGTIQITDTLYSLGGLNQALMQGTIDLSITYSRPGASGSLVQSTARLPVVNGALSFCAPAGASIVANYQVRRPAPLTGIVTFTRYWAVPPACGPYKLLDDGIEIAAPIQVPVSIGNYCLTNRNGELAWIQGACTNSTYSYTGSLNGCPAPGSNPLISRLGDQTVSAFGDIPLNTITVNTVP